MAAATWDKKASSIFMGPADSKEKCYFYEYVILFFVFICFFIFLVPILESCERLIYNFLRLVVVGLATELEEALLLLAGLSRT